MPNAELLESIRRVEADMEKAQEDIKTLNEQLKQGTEGLPEYAAVAELAEDLKLARAKLKQAIASDRELQEAASEKEEIIFKLRDMKEILSHHLIAYHSETNETQLATENGRARDILMSAKLGKEVFYQERMKLEGKK